MARQGDSSSAAAAAFQPTQWALVLAVRQADTAEAHTALNRLCEVYWYPVYAFLRRRGYDRHRSKDLTQELFAQFIEKRSFAVADQERGKFRSFLLGCLRHLLSHAHKKENAIRRGGQFDFVPLDEILAENRYGAEPADEVTPERLFERRWALALLDQAMNNLQREYREAGRERHFEVLHVFLSGAREAANSYQDAAGQLGLTENAVRQSAFRMRGRFGELLRELVAQTVAGPKELEEELAHFRQALSR